MENIKKIMDLILKDADKRASDAGYAGRQDDGGASRLRDQVKFYKAGMKGDTPEEWYEYVKNTDPEYSEYVRLKQKFEK